MRATILLTAMLVAGSAYAETETVAIPTSPVTTSEAPAAAAACPCAEGASTASTATGFGSSARGWVDLQASGSAASVTARPLPGDAATNAYERYANSFKHPIPESFKRESFSTDGGK